MIAGALALAYLFAMFTLSAAAVRLFPHGRVARTLRLELGYFPLLPLLLTMALARFVAGLIRRLALRGQDLFVLLSGHGRYRRHSYYYKYVPRERSKGGQLP